ncbi:hypothetical protein [Azospirillum picis]|uniref:Uncharacterized protein n=1 Tax=Azospirillum picis TaxID=488438 RepID=A0ABU0MS03_9PROT|nr:hypothetical protein [Azospirillum picis]MBP2302496.1 hypothetical protein [Azospirillum picis]MDQ0536262.1 hypothetical protein [Azospirillum picis]
MLIVSDHTPRDTERKPDIRAAIAVYVQQSDELHAAYVGRPYDSVSTAKIDQLHADLDAALTAALPITDAAEAAALIELEVKLFREFEGDAPDGIHLTRLTILEEARDFLRRYGEQVGSRQADLQDMVTAFGAEAPAMLAVPAVPGDKLLEASAAAAGITTDQARIVYASMLQPFVGRAA